MKRGLVLLVALAAACGRDATTPAEPIASDLTGGAGSPTAIVVVDGMEYQIGCPEYPCPVTQIVLDHISQGQYFWLPSGTFRYPTIYLNALRVPVQLKPVPTVVIIDPPPEPEPPVPPSLTGPWSVQGRSLPPIGQITCGDFKLQLVNPDGGPWTFVSGTVEYEYVMWDSDDNAYVPTGASSVVAFSAQVWSQLLAGTYRLYPPFPEMEYWAHFTVMLKRGDYEEEVSHTLLCVTDLPEPWLEGPVALVGTRPDRDSPLVCGPVDLDLISPDGGPWDFVSGQRLIEFMSWDKVLQMFVKNGQTALSSLSSSDWQALLDGTYAIDPGIPSGPYMTTFTVDLKRDSFENTVSHTLGCGGHDFVEMLLGGT